MQQTENIIPIDDEDFVLEDEALLLELVRAIVSQPEDVKIVSTHAPEATVLTIYVADKDRGHVIGKEKRTIAALEHLFAKVAFMAKRKIHLQLGGQDVKNGIRKGPRRDN